MSDIDRNDLHTRNATAYFETRAAADAAVNDLVAAGIAREQISVAGTGASGATGTTDNRCFWEELKDLFLPAEDRYAYAEGLRRGGFVVSVRTEETEYERVLEILDREGAVDLDKQEASWRGEGWTGYPGEGAAAASAPAGMASQRDLVRCPHPRLPPRHVGRRQPPELRRWFRFTRSNFVSASAM